jgi:hypothetical protein
MGVFSPMGHSTCLEDLLILAGLAHSATRSDKSAGIFVEVGTWAGQSALVLAPFCSRLFCVDTWEGNPEDHLGGYAKNHGSHYVFGEFCKNMGSLLYDKVYPIKERSWAVANNFNQKADLIFIDANHTQPQVEMDILGWAKHVRGGGILCGHDYSDQFPGVKNAVDRLIPASSLTVDGTVWWTVCP